MRRVFRRLRGAQGRKPMRRPRVDDDGAHFALVAGPAQAGIADDVFRQHHGAVHHDAEVDGAHGNQIGRHAQQVQADEGHQQRQRNHGGHDQRATDAAQHQPQHADDQAGTEQQVVLHGGLRVADEVGAVVGNVHLHAFGQQAVVELDHLFVDAVEDQRRVFAALEQHDVLHHVVFPVHAHGALRGVCDWITVATPMVMGAPPRSCTTTSLISCGEPSRPMPRMISDCSPRRSSPSPTLRLDFSSGDDRKQAGCAG